MNKIEITKNIPEKYREWHYNKALPYETTFVAKQYEPQIPFVEGMSMLAPEDPKVEITLSEYYPDGSMNTRKFILPLSLHPLEAFERFKTDGYDYITSVFAEELHDIFVKDPPQKVELTEHQKEVAREMTRKLSKS